MLRVAIVGLGWWGRKLAEQVAGSRLLQLVVAAEPDAGVAAQLGPKSGVPILSTLADVLRRDDVEAVLLATPHQLHDGQIADAAAAGKHIFCEKPLSLTYEGARRSVELCRGKGLVLGIGHERRFEPPVSSMLGAARAGELGTLLHFEGNFSHDKFVSLAAGNWRLSAESAPAGGMTATGIHLFDLATALFGPARDVFVSSKTLASNIANGDTTSALVRYRGGQSAFVATLLATPFISRLALYGSDGWMEVRDKAHVEAPEGWVVTRCRKGGRPEVSDVPVTTPVRDNLEAFARAVRGTAPYPITPDELLANTAVMEAIFRSARTGTVEAVAGP
ncbi:MAG: Gfo/Idh/MocA family oxidoreductase [Rhodospirillales bacterium]|nr:Gfo/Idh/MocA family oxidoreductase [Rhodospirillales bacterium]